MCSFGVSGFVCLENLGHKSLVQSKIICDPAFQNESDGYYYQVIFSLRLVFEGSVQILVFQQNLIRLPSLFFIYLYIMSLKLTKDVLFIFKHAQVCLLLRDVSLSQYHYHSISVWQELHWFLRLRFCGGCNFKLIINITRPVNWSLFHYFNENFALSSGLFYNTKVSMLLISDGTFGRVTFADLLSKAKLSTTKHGHSRDGWPHTSCTTTVLGFAPTHRFLWSDSFDKTEYRD